MRLERKDIHLDKETPYISLYDTELKTQGTRAYRTATLPL